MEIYVKTVCGKWLLTEYTDLADIHRRAFREHCFDLARKEHVVLKLSSNGDFEIKIEYPRKVAN